ncbi:MAG TPA: MFS transporter, partial [Paraburkholderia sp.]
MASTQTIPAPDVQAVSGGIDQKSLRRIVMASVAGNALEWYDFFLYSTAAALVFGELFFPKGTDP